MTTRNTALILLASALLAACGREDEAGGPERAELRRAAARDVCIAEELAVRGRENLASLDSLAMAMGGPQGQGPMRAAYEFARVYRGYADARLAVVSYADSAINARTPADSARYVARARGYDIRPGERGTIEGNVAEQHAREFATARANPAHFCNQDPLGGGGADEKE